MSAPVTDFIAMEARFGAQNYKPLGVILSRGEGVRVWIRKAIVISTASRPILR